MYGNFNRKILIIDADESSDAAISEYFGGLGYVCRAVTTLKEGISCLSEEKFDGVISEFNLPDGAICDLLGKSGLPPIIVYSAESGDDAIVETLNRGAADYVLKPCSPRVMAARLESRLPAENKTIECRGLSLNVNLRAVSYCGQPVRLTSCEFNILRFLMTNPGKFFTADEIYEKVWNAVSMQTSVIRFHISNLKKTLLAATGKNLIVSEFGTGYTFAPDDR